MERTAVESSDLAIVGYDRNTLILEIAFRNGGVYQYKEVPEYVHTSLMFSPSHGAYFKQNIKGRYPFTKVT